MNSVFLVFYEFFKIGIFAVGGGYATIPFLFRLTEIYNWFNKTELLDMIALSNITPGPVGINMATYSGFKSAKILGSILSTLGIILGPFIITLCAIYFINKFKNSIILQNIFNALKPVSCALLSYVLIGLVQKNIFYGSKLNLKSAVLTFILFVIYPKLKSRPSFIILTGGLLGILFNCF